MNDIVPTPSLDTWHDNQLITVGDLNSNIRDPQLFLAHAPMTIVARIATQSIPSGSSTAITFDTEIIDIDGMFAGPSTNLTIQRPGVYSLQFQSHFASNATGARAGYIKLNGDIVASSSNQSANGVATLLNTSTILALNTADVITAGVWQNSGGNLDSGSSGYAAPRLAIRLLSTAELDVDYENPAPPSSTPPTGSTPTLHSATFYATWSRTYDGDMGTTWDDSKHCYQGRYGPNPARGNTKSLVGFNYNAIKNTLAGATQVAGVFWAKLLHSYFYSGLPSTWVRYHDYASKPSTYDYAHTNTMGSYNVNVPRGAWMHCNLSGQAVYALAFGNAKGMGIGPAGSAVNGYYGYYAGALESGRPYLKFTYWK